MPPFARLNPLEHVDWNDRYVPAGADAFFFTAEWARVLQESYGFTPAYLVATATDPRGTAVVPLMEVRSRLTGRRGVGLPFSDSCTAGTLDASQVDALLECLRQTGQRNRWRYFELRGAGLPATLPTSALYWRHDLDLSAGETALFEQLEGSVRTSIRKAVKSGVEVQVLTSPEAVGAFCRLNARTRRRHGLPPQPFAFFRNLHRHVLAADKGCVVQAVYQGRVIAASVYAHHGRHAVYKYGASDERFQALRGANVVMWEAIRRYAAGGFAGLSLGRSALAHAGLRRYKLGWGASESPLRYHRYEFRTEQFVARAQQDPEDGYPLARLLPLCCLRLAGRMLYKHMG
jgi:hypothetical protein